jgi:hypothetical protein
MIIAFDVGLLHLNLKPKKLISICSLLSGLEDCFCIDIVCVFIFYFHYARRAGTKIVSFFDEVNFVIKSDDNSYNILLKSKSS